MSTKDYKAIAAILAGSFATATPAEKGIVWVTTLSLADYFAKDNSRFDRSKFYAAVLGDSDHFAVRDRITALKTYQVLGADSPAIWNPRTDSNG